MDKFMDNDKLTREQWILINQMSNAIWNINSVFCAGRNNQEEYTTEELEMLVKGIAEKCNSVMAMDDMIWLMEEAKKEIIKNINGRLELP